MFSLWTLVKWPPCPGNSEFHDDALGFGFIPYVVRSVDFSIWKLITFSWGNFKKIISLIILSLASSSLLLESQLFGYTSLILLPFLSYIPSLSFCCTLWDICSSFISAMNLFISRTLFLKCPPSLFFFFIAFHFYFLGGMISLYPLRDILFVLFCFTFSSLCKSIFSKFPFRKVTCFFSVSFMLEDFSRCLLSLLVWQGWEFIKLWVQERNLSTLVFPIAQSKWHLYNRNSQIIIFGFIFSLGMFKLPREESFSLCWER